MNRRAFVGLSAAGVAAAFGLRSTRWFTRGSGLVVPEAAGAVVNAGHCLVVVRDFEGNVLLSEQFPVIDGCVTVPPLRPMFVGPHTITASSPQWDRGFSFGRA